MLGDSKISFHLFVLLSPFSDAQKIKNQLEKIFHRVGRIGKTIIFSENLTGGAGYLGLQTPGFRISKYCFVRLLEAFVSIPLCNSPASLSHPTRETMRHANALSCNGKPPVCIYENYNLSRIVTQMNVRIRRGTLQIRSIDETGVCAPSALLIYMYPDYDICRRAFPRVQRIKPSQVTLLSSLFKNPFEK